MAGLSSLFGLMMLLCGLCWSAFLSAGGNFLGHKVSPFLCEVGKV